MASGEDVGEAVGGESVDEPVEESAEGGSVKEAEEVVAPAEEGEPVDEESAGEAGVAEEEPIAGEEEPVAGEEPVASGEEVRRGACRVVFSCMCWPVSPSRCWAWRGLQPLTPGAWGCWRGGGARAVWQRQRGRRRYGGRARRRGGERGGRGGARARGERSGGFRHWGRGQPRAL